MDKDDDGHAGHETMSTHNEDQRSADWGAGAPFASVFETHTGVVIFLGDRAYKLKKPVRYGFVDFTTREARRRACQREVELNGRLAPDVYLGVADVIGPEGTLWDHLVVMRRLPEGRSLSKLAVGAHDLEAPLRQLASVLATFHRRAQRSPACDEAAGRDTTLARWETNAREMAPLLGRVFDRRVHERVLMLARRYLSGRAALFEHRVRAGRSRDGHGDLLADDVFCLEDGPRVLDCLEFDDQLRYGDVLNDTASLAMDLERLGCREAALTFLSSYRASSGDDWPSSLGHHYIAYRAQVRALVAGLRMDQGDAHAGVTARSLLALCQRHLEAGRIRLIVVGGLPGSGKSTWAAAAAEPLDAVVLRSDSLRKTMAGLDPNSPAPAGFEEGLYSSASTAATYTELLAQAESHLRMGHSVVLDATFEDPTWRRGARSVASRAAADLLELRCVAPLEVLEARVAKRSARQSGPSDATVEVLRQFASVPRPWPEATVLATNRPTAAVQGELMAVLGLAGG